ncbi:MAG TPA: arginase [Crocinitomicaceae bacterium]|nr:arginase [Crocinitomicaceae bacterium]
MRKAIQFIINSSEITAGTRGASLGPFAILTAARKQSKTLFNPNTVQYLPNQNHVLDLAPEPSKAKNIQGYSQLFGDIVETVGSVIKDGKFPFVIAGDHGSAAATVSAMKIAEPTKRLGVIWIDAHADLHSPYTTPSGNMHGMPLSIPLDSDNLECKVNELSSDIVEAWDKLKNYGNISPKISPDDLIYIGVRDTEEQEDFLINKLNIKNFTVAEVEQLKAKEVARQILAKLSACDWIYLTWDVDSMDPKLSSYGTGTPVENGLQPDEVKLLILELLQSPKIGCFEVVEVNPCLDDKVNRMAEIALDVIEESVNVLSK